MRFTDPPTPEQIREWVRSAPDHLLVKSLSDPVSCPAWEEHLACWILTARDELEARGVDTSAAFEGDEVRADRRYELDPTGSRVQVLAQDREALEAAYGPHWDAPPVPRRAHRGGLAGWRQWRLLEHKETGTPTLGSLWNTTVWETPVLRAYLPSPHEKWKFAAPGIHSWSPEVGREGRTLASVEGHVLHFGRVMVHERGYRSQYALIRDLTLRYCPEVERGTVRLFRSYASIFWDIPEVTWYLDGGYREAGLCAMTRDEAEFLAQGLARRYDCPVTCEPISYEEVEELWKLVP